MPADHGGRPPYRSELLTDLRLVWLVTVRYAGREFRFSTEPITVDRADGTVLEFDGGLDPFSLRLSLALFTDDPEILSVSVTTLFPVSVADLAQQGHDLSTATAEVALLVVGNTWENRWRVLDGDVRNPTYGRDDEPVHFAVRQSALDDLSVWPPREARVTTTTWPSAPEGSLGKPYVTVFGAPGHFYRPDGVEKTIATSPAIIVNSTAGAANRVLINDGLCHATSVTLFHDAGSDVLSVETSTDGLGRTVSTLNVSGLSASARATTDFRVGWHNGGGLRGPSNETISTTPLALQGLGDVISWWLERTSLNIDRGRWRAVLSELNGYSVAGWVDEEVTPWELVTDHLLPLAPLTVLSGPGGHYPVLWRLDTTRDTPHAHLTVEPGIDLMGEVEYERGHDDVYSEIRLAWAWDPVNSTYRQQWALTPDPDLTSPRQLGSSFCESSYRRYRAIDNAGNPLPPRSLLLESQWLYDGPTAAAIAGWVIVAKGFAQRLLSYEADASWLWLELGSAANLTDSELYLSGVPALLHAVDVDASGRILLQFQLHDLASPPRATGPNPTTNYSDAIQS